MTTFKHVMLGRADDDARPGGVLLPLLVLILSALALQPVLADDEITAADDDAATISLDELLGDAAAISDDDLELQRARAMLEVEKVVINEQNLNGVVSGNTAIDTVTGHNTINGEAFSGAAGFVSSIQNTGNNVLIQSSTIVNVTVEP